VSRTLAVTALRQSASAGAALAEAALASTVDSVVGLDSIVALASIVDSDPAPSPSIAVSDLGLASTVDLVVGLDSVGLVVDGKVDADWRVDCQQAKGRPPSWRPFDSGLPVLNARLHYCGKNSYA
jgi:hypothetical protein